MITCLYLCILQTYAILENEIRNTVSKHCKLAVKVVLKLAEIYFCTGSVTGDVLRLLANGLGTTCLNNCHDNAIGRKRKGRYKELFCTRN